MAINPFTLNFDTIIPFTIPKLSDPQTIWNYFSQEARFVEHVRLGLGVSPLPTAMRNYTAQGMQYALSAIEDAMSTAFTDLMKGYRKATQYIPQGGIGNTLQRAYTDLS